MAALSQGIAALPMYDRPEIMGATDRFWARVRDALRARGIDAPAALLRNADDLMQVWLSPDLVLGQTCGLPYRAHLKDAVTLVGTPDYGLPGCAPGYYRSVIVARGALPRDWRGLRLALNDPGSQSGWAALANDWPGNLPGAVLLTGSHAASLAAVAEGRADLAALDAQSWRLLQRWVAAAAAVTVVAETTPTPGLPYITRAGQDPAPYRAAIAAAIADLSTDDRHALGLTGLAVIPASAYLAVPIPPPPARLDPTER
jgi:ABC-type phosphate/phosphonate transport system substrate-binding protein